MHKEQDLILRFEFLTRELARANGRRRPSDFDEESFLEPGPARAQTARERVMSELVWFRRRRGETLFTLVRQIERGEEPEASWRKAERERRRRLRRAR